MLVDALLIIFIISGFVSGFRRGLIYSLFAFVAMFLGILLSMKYSYLVSGYLYRLEITESRFLPFISFVIILFCALVVMKLCFSLVQSAAETIFLGTINKIIGGILWAAILVFAYSTVLWYLDKLHLISEEMKDASKSYHFLIFLAPWVIEEFSRLLPYFQGMFDSIENLFKEPASQGIQV